MDHKIILTGDGSHSLFSEEIGESYHSKFGALNESRHVFIQAGYNAIGDRDEIYILEVGFGTGLNAWLTLKAANQKRVSTYYDALEPYPLGSAAYMKLNYPAFESDETLQSSFIAMHESAWNKATRLTEFFIFRKIKMKFEEFIHGKNRYDLVYFDAFSPEVQPELWTENIFVRVHSFIKPGGILVTYSAKGSVRRNLIKSGFRVERLAGPTGKREMIRANKIAR
jgi:tRNA U34 5-methylaminomethyl-2-thiouridine-forming methyltransferase MnmC